MSQYIPKTAMSRLVPSTSSGTAAHPGSPVCRSEACARRPSQRMREPRWAAMTHNSAAVATIAPSVAPMTWPMAEPPAGGELLFAKTIDCSTGVRPSLIRGSSFHVSGTAFPKPSAGRGGESDPAARRACRRRIKRIADQADDRVVIAQVRVVDQVERAVGLHPEVADPSFLDERG